ncbi:MAG: serine hydrolase [Anaerolineaceae bacterium]|nr:serine hydrolase [Anaerolineaceae bacterium]
MKKILIFHNIVLVLSTLAALVILVLVVWMLIAGPQTVLRILRFGDTKIDDFRHEPVREMTSSPVPYTFAPVSSQDRLNFTVPVPSGSTSDLDALLSSNDTIAFLVLKDDQLVIERYYQGHTANTRSQAFSMAKSFTSTLVGLAIEDGYFTSVDQSITDFIPELSPHGFDKVTLLHLLTMTSGSAYQENDNPFGVHVILNYTPHLEQRILTFRMADEPGTVWRYKSGDNALLGLALSRVLAPNTIAGYMQERVWDPVGMEAAGSWSLDHAGDGLEKTWCCLAATPPDFLKLGRLYLHDGVWEGRQVLPEGWVQESTQLSALPDSIWDADFRQIGIWNYGYQWWLVSKEDGSYLANGKDGQFLYINPAKDTVILRLGWSTGSLPLSQWIALFQHLADAK